ncbi:Regulator of Ty1 transposition protein [Teratosphaeria destructans]|uniref:Regulator of Ty1 transposition protein n=1 Tax=Teratosphaeria destructans TaxID=418781 RepID=A0A9W7SI18_9PEZI|nr:Regulator of Ty1 transposition protein [Teratosphaeria destructans]
MEHADVKQIFEGVAFAVIPSEQCDADEVADTIRANGGQHIPLRDSDNQVPNLTEVSYVVSASIDFPQYNDAVERGIHVVKPSWVQASLRKGKMAGPRQHSPDPSQFFQDVTVTFAELPEGDKDAIHAGVIALGGVYSGVLSKLCTHVVTTDEGHAKCITAREKKVNCKIVLPQWFDDCFRVGKKINERPYTFPNPPLLQYGEYKPATSDSLHLEGATTDVPDGEPTPSMPPGSPTDQRRNLNAFQGRQVRLSPDLELNQHLRNTLKGLIRYGGGTLCDNVEECDIYVGRYRDGEEYKSAARAQKEVANLAWLYHVINHNKYTNPLSKLLHYPVPRNGIKGFENMRISISNYNGDARVYLENLITLCGAEFTKTMKQDNTHLITAHQQSEKVEAAQEWNIHIINASWIEDCYAQCTPLSLTNQKYTHFPPKSHLGEVCGQATLNMKKVEQLYFPKTRPSPQKQQFVVRGGTSPRKTVPASSAGLGGGVQDDTPAYCAPEPIPEDQETEDEEEAQPQPQSVKKPGGRSKKTLLATPRLTDDKENQSPAVTSTGRRKAKMAADKRIHDSAPDIALYEKEKKRKGGVTHGGRRSSHMNEMSSPAPAPKERKKRKSDEATYDVTAEGSDLSDGETQPAKAKKAKHTQGQASFPEVKYKLMVTGDERWVGKPKEEDAAKTTLRMLGVQLVTDPKEVDILVAPKILRTRKFVAALACAPTVVDTRYLDAALKQRKLIEPPGLLFDRDGEERMGFKLTEALERAQVNDRKLLRDWSIFVTRDVPGGFDTYKEIITLNGGNAHLYTGRTGLVLPRRKRDDPDAGPEAQNQGGDEEFGLVYLVSGTSEPERKLWKSFRSTVEKQHLKPRVARNDWLLNAAMSQKVGWDEKWMLDEA